MKKGQLLAALALAFALGVVAPVAGVYNSASAVTISDGQVLSSEADVQATIDAIEKNTEYQQYKALINALNMKDASNTAITDNTVTATNVSDLAAKIVALDEGTTPSGVAYDYSEYTAPTTGSNASKMQTVIDDAKAAIANVTGKSYKLWSNLYDAYNSTSTATSADQKAQNVVDAAEALGMTVKDFVSGTTTFEQVKTQIDSTSYANYEATIALINADQVKVDDVDAVVRALTAALAPFAKAQTISEASETSTPIADLTALKPGLTSGTGKNYADLVSAVATATTNVENGLYDDLETEGVAATAQITSLKAAYKLATGSDLSVSTPVDPEDPSTPAVSTITNADGKVAVTGNFPEGVYVEVISDGIVLPENFEGFGEPKNAIYNINLRNADGTIYEVKQTVVVSIAVPEGIDGANSDVIYITAMGGAENMKAKYADGYMTFTTNHFSIYAIVERAAGDAGDHTETPGNTGAVAQAEGTASATGILAGIAAALTAAGAGVVAFRNARRNAKKNA